MDEALKEGPVYIIKNDRPRYVVLDEERYRELLESAEEGYVARVRASLDDVAAGRVRTSSAEDLIRKFRLED